MAQNRPGGSLLGATGWKKGSDGMCPARRTAAWFASRLGSSLDDHHCSPWVLANKGVTARPRCTAPSSSLPYHHSAAQTLQRPRLHCLSSQQHASGTHLEAGLLILHTPGTTSRFAGPCNSGHTPVALLSRISAAELRSGTTCAGVALDE